VEEGIVVGGGVALIRCIPALESLALAGDEAIGIKILKHAMAEPTRALAENAGVEGSTIVKEVQNLKGNTGYNVATHQLEDLAKAGVVDPTKVTRFALQNAASIAGLLLTTECIVCEAPQEKGEPAAGDQYGSSGDDDY
jgi:chaperonin GroEL